MAEAPPDAGPATPESVSERSPIPATRQLRRQSFLGRSLDLCLGLLALVFLLSSLGRILGIGGAEATVAQFLLAAFALLLLGLAGIRGGSRLVGCFAQSGGTGGARLTLALMPFLALALFLPFRLRITDIEAYKVSVAEGSVVEWLSFLFLLAAGVLFLLTARGEWRPATRGVGFTFLFLGLLSLVIAMEEMSWGQTIFNWGTPELFNETNVQHETNLHNLAPFNDFIWIATAVVFCLITLLILLRMLLSRGSRLRSHSIADALLPSPVLFGYFFLAALVYVGVAVEKLGHDLPVLVTREQEVAECLFALGVLLHAGRSYLRWGPDPAPLPRSPG